MKRWTAVIVVWMWAFAAWAGNAEYKRGDFSFSVGPAPAFVRPHPVAERWDARTPGIDEGVWRYWLYDSQVDRRKRIDAAYVDYAFEPRSASKLQDAGKFEIEFNPEYQNLVLHAVELRRAGKWHDRLLPDKISLARREADFEQDMSDGRVSALIVLDDVRVGDVVRISYTISGSNPILAGQAWDSTATAFLYPMHHLHMRVLFDPGTPLRSHVQNGAAAPVVRESADSTEVTVDVHGTAPLVDEGNYPVWYDPRPSVQVGPARGWADVVAWALPLYPRVEGPLPQDLETRIAAWKKLPDPQARLRAVLRAVQDEVRYFGVEMGSNTHQPTPPADTWRRRFGDCKDKAYLLSTILARLDIQAVPALVSTNRGRALRDIEPTAAAFNHVIARATIGGETIWMDPTITHQGGDPRDFDLSDYGAVLPILAGTTGLQAVAVPVKPADGVAIQERFIPQTKGGLRYEAETTYTGADADRMRRSVAETRGDDLDRRYADYYRKRYGALDVLDAPQVKDDRDANTLVVREAYLLKDPYVKEGANLGLDTYALGLDNPTDPPRTIQRRGPLELGTPSRYRHDIRFEVPAGWRPTFGEEKDDLSTDGYVFHSGVERSDTLQQGVVELHYTLDVRVHDLPAEAANRHLAELRRMRDLLSSRLRFALPAERLDQDKRDARLKALLRDVMGDSDQEQDKGTQ